MRPSPRQLSRIARRSVAATTVVGGALLLTAGPASAHVGIAEGEQAADSYTVLSFGVPHGCDESPTTKIRIQLPENLPTATPTVNPGWDIEIVKEQLAEPIDIGEGRTLTERITEIDYTAKAPLPIEFRDVLQLSVHIPADAAGTTMWFPTIQECAEGETAWTMIPEEGQDPEELEHPAPGVKIVESTGGGHGGGATTTEAADADEPATTAASTGAADADDNSDSDGSTQGLAIAGLATGVVGMALGGRALVASKSSGGGGSA